MSGAEVEAAVARARLAQAQWATTTFAQRRRLLRILSRCVLDHAEVICRVSARDSGKTMVDASFGEVLVTLEKLHWLCSNEAENAITPEGAPARHTTCPQAECARVLAPAPPPPTAAAPPWTSPCGRPGTAQPAGWSSTSARTSSGSPSASLAPSCRGTTHSTTFSTRCLRLCSPETPSSSRCVVTPGGSRRDLGGSSRHLPRATGLRARVLVVGILRPADQRVPRRRRRPRRPCAAGDRLRRDGRGARVSGR